MNITVLGISHKTADLALRERLVFTKNELADALDSLLSLPEVSEAVIVSTCNRTEIYCVTSKASEVFEWLVRYKQIDSGQLIDVCYTFQDLLAVEHLMRVASGLESMVLGEPQILGQIKSGFSDCCLHASVGQHLSRLFRETFAVAKQVRTTTAIGACPVSVASTTVERVGEQVSLSDATVMIVGSGDTSELLAKYLVQKEPQKIYVAGRTKERAAKIALQVAGEAILLTELSEYLSKSDVVISATASPDLVITQDHIQYFNEEQACVLVDIAVPRDIDSALGEQKNLTLLTIDDLKNTIQENVDSREHAAVQAQNMIESLSRKFMMSLQSLSADDVIKQFRKQIENLCSEENRKALKAYRRGEEIEFILKNYTDCIAKKLMHTPSVQLRQASAEGRSELLTLVNELFNLQEA